MTQPLERTRPYIPGYGIPKSKKGMLEWDWVVERMAQPKNYWITTVTPDNRPHAVPVWGVWVDNTLYFGGGESTRWSRNLKVNPTVAVHLESGSEVVILEGTVFKHTEANTDTALITRLDDAYEAKYNMRHGTPFWELQPHKAFAWNKDLTTATRWLFTKDSTM